MQLFNTIGRELEQTLHSVNQVSKKTGFRVSRLGLTWEVRTNAALANARLPKTRDLFLSGKNKPVYFRIKVNIEPLSGNT